MTIVIDASVLVAAAVDVGSMGRWAETLIEHEQLCAPEIVQVETANILRRLEVARQIDSRFAESAFDDLLALNIELYPFGMLAPRVWALRSNVTCYDAGYVALAESLEAPLATLDRKLTRATGPRCAFRLPP